jgi:quinol monooxygenase YgiN
MVRLTTKLKRSEKSLRRLAKLTRQEPGSLCYTLHRSSDDPAVWNIYEIWTSRAALDAHFNQPYMRESLVRAPELPGNRSK